MAKILITIIAIAAIGFTAYTVVQSPSDESSQDAMENDDSMMMEDDDDDDSMMMEDDDDDDSMMMEDDDDSMMMEDEGAMMNDSEGVYTAFTSDVLGNGQESVLFFHAAWCPDCRANDENLSAWYPSDDFVSVYKIDYDSATELKKQFGIVQQDTFIRVDGSGNAVQETSFPSESALQAFIAR